MTNATLALPDRDWADDPTDIKIEHLRALYPTEPEVDRTLTRKMKRRALGPYRRMDLDEFVRCVESFLSTRIDGPFRVSDARWFTGGVSKIRTWPSNGCATTCPSSITSASSTATTAAETSSTTNPPSRSRPGSTGNAVISATGTETSPGPHSPPSATTTSTTATSFSAPSALRRRPRSKQRWDDLPGRCSCSPLACRVPRAAFRVLVRRSAAADFIGEIIEDCAAVSRTRWWWVRVDAGASVGGRGR